MLFSVHLITAALVLYSLAIWSEKIKKHLKPWMIRIFILAFSCDVIGTTMMFFRNKTHHINFHTICGYLALLIMGLHLAWAIAAIKQQGKMQCLFRRFSVYAWFIWLVAFITGIPN